MGIDPVDNYSLSGYAGMANNPISYIDPDGRNPILVGAALVGGGMNLWSNWSKIKGTGWKGFAHGASYFASGAAGGIATVLSGGNAALGGGITASANVGIDLLTGNTPSFKNLGEGVQYAGLEIGKGILFSIVGNEFGKFIGPKIGALYGWMQSGYINSQAFTEKIGEQLYTFAGSAGVKSSFGKLAGTVASSVAGAADDVGRGIGNTVDNVHPNGSFSIKDWSAYPTAGNVPRPSGPFRVIEGAEYDQARSLANRTNEALKQQGVFPRGVDIHEIHPVKFGGSPTNLSNKIGLPRANHSPYTTWWNRLQRSLK